MTSTQPPKLRFFLDASVPESVALVIESHGHQAIRHHQALAEGTTDAVVCETAIQNEAILVAVDSDMKHLSKRFKNANDRFKKLSLVMISCSGVMASKRLDHAMSLIEHEWSVSVAKVSRRLWFEISNHQFTTYR